jgi:SagB-type dehydrogenase family enzyme
LSRNRDLDAALKYHNGTKHSYLSLRAHPHFLDWQNKPLLFKIYPTLEVMRLPRDLRQTGVSALSAITSGSSKAKGKAIPDLDALAQLLFLSAGVTKSKKYPGGEVFFRAAACTGALYEIELYIVCADLPGLAAGVYHFGAAEFGLRLLRAGDYRDVVIRASGNEKNVARAPVIVICTGVYWRNAWKYRSRTYRHFGWDNGTILANMLAVGTSMGLPTRVITGFADAEINRLLDIDTSKEVAFSMVAVGKMTGRAPASEKHLEPLRLSVVPYSKEEVEYPAMRQMHTASSLTAEEVRGWREGGEFQKSPRSAAGLERPLSLLSAKSRSTDTIEQVIQRRGSTRQFSREAISFQQLSTILESSTRGITADFLEPYGTFLNDIYLIVNNVDGLPAGAYFYSPKKQKLELLKAGNFRQEAGYLGLEQQLPADASVDKFFLADLNNVLGRFGNRGYRAVQLEAGIIGGKLYLAAYAQRLGATGLTFYDDDVINFFSPETRGKSAIFLVAIGKSRSEPSATRPSPTGSGA